MLLSAISLCINITLRGSSAPFDSLFSDRTLRIDYILVGTPASPSIATSGTGTFSGWSGPRTSLDRYPLAGNIHVTVTDSLSGDTIYTSGLSSLYCEWLELKDSVARAYQCPVIMPRPRRSAVISLKVNNSRHQTIAEHKMPYSPQDILVRELSHSPYKCVPIHTGSFAGTKIPVAILPEGFRECEMDSFHIYAQRTVDAILSHEPFTTYAERFDFFAVDVPSADSDVSQPAQKLWRDTAFGSHFSTFMSDRYLTTSSLFKVHDALAGTPYQHIIILANTPVYGGGGIFNSYTLTNTGNPYFLPVVVHEFGHSFGGLADEYFYDNDVFTDTYPLDIEPWEPNITTRVNFNGKWENLLKEGTPVPTPANPESVALYPVGLYEGGGYSSHGIFRPADQCRMRTNDIDSFCPACQQALSRLILYLTGE